MLLMRDPPGGLALDVPRQLREVRVDALIEQVADGAQQHDIAERRDDGAVEAAVHVHPMLERELGTDLGEHRIQPGDVRWRGQARRLLRHRALHERAGAQHLERTLDHGQLRGKR